MKDLFVLCVLFFVVGIVFKGGVVAVTFPKHIVNQVVFVESKTGFCSGIILGTNYVLTAAHGDGEFYVGGLPAKILKKDSRYDLIHLQTQFTFDKSQHIKFASTLSPAEPLWIVGCFSGQPVIIRGYVSRLEDEIFWVDAKVIAGFSGGGVFNEKGELVGLYIGGKGTPDMLGVAFNLKRIYTFLGIDFDKAKILEP